MKNSYIILILFILLLSITGCYIDLESKVKDSLGITNEQQLAEFPTDKEIEDLTKYAQNQGYGSVKNAEQLTAEDGTTIISGELSKPNTYLVKSSGERGEETFIQEVYEEEGHLIVKKITENNVITIDLTTMEVLSVE